MAQNQLLNAYKKSETQANIHPVKLIHMMYERVLVHLELAEAGIHENNPQKRGENLGKAIAIITELNASIKKEDASQSADFLRGLYSAILFELPKVSISNDAKVVRQSLKYITRLKEVWEQTAMEEHGFSRPAAKGRENEEERQASSRLHDEGFQSASEEKGAAHGVSFSI